MNLKQLVDKSLLIWEKILSFIFVLKVCDVNKPRFLRRTFSKYVDSDTLQKAIDSSLFANYIDNNLIVKLLKKNIRLTGLLVALISFVMAIPQTGPLMWAGCVVDFIQFQIFVFIVMKKILICYDESKISGQIVLRYNEENNKGWRKVVRMLTSFFGMLITSVIKRAGRQIITRLLLLNVIKQFLKFLEVDISFAEMNGVLNNFIVYFNCTVYGVISYFLFAPMLIRQLGKINKDFLSNY